MTLAKHQVYVVNDVGDTISSASVTVRHEADQVNAEIYSDATATNSISNPLSSDADGLAEFYAPQGTYRVTAAFSGDQSDFRDVNISHPFAPVNTVSTDSYQLSEVDFNNYLLFTNADSATIVLPSSLGHDFEEIHIEASSGTGLYTITASATLLLPASGSAVIIPDGVVTLKRRANNVWKLFGHTVGA